MTASVPASAAPRLGEEIRHIARHAWPILVAQLASMGLMLIDTALLGHYGAADLAAVAIGGGIGGGPADGGIAATAAVGKPSAGAFLSSATMRV